MALKALQDSWKLLFILSACLQKDGLPQTHTCISDELNLQREGPLTLL